ncbi:TlpA disulfide reductase family protein [Siphonobacter sp. SORGH_AS_1065]|uniref:TlpA disulfide reductase family protein n=1 Tax=Siphonobacter sp. SORGH_AS_1065 TaxID=3041795 RepID=UPI0027880497|nr:TlpA disulfide reductase family protein [Siphonobacter sp. SORGH_AS_1065]MDQ1090177.1 peroxiredoxin [Siphonobacter sp. SORGH_AS_1065]
MNLLKSLTLVAGLGLTSLAQAQTPVNISGTVVGINTGKVYLQRFHNKMFYTVEAVPVKDGKFQIQRKLQLPEVYGITIDTTRGNQFLFLDATDTKVTISLDSAARYRNTKVTGSKGQELLASFRQGQEGKIEDFIKKNPASIVPTYILYREYSYRLTPEEIEKNVALLDASLQKTPYVKTLKELVTTLRSVQVGEKAKDFQANTPEGKPLRLSSLYGKSYILVDFWAAWCGPCRHENPNLVKTYEKYKGQGFTILGVSLDHTKEAWLKAIAKDQLTWHQVSDLKYWNSEPAQLYGVRAIPSNVLLDAEGRIVARNLRGEELGAKLEDLYSKSAANK